MAEPLTSHCLHWDDNKGEVCCTCGRAFASVEDAWASSGCPGFPPEDQQAEGSLGVPLIVQREWDNPEDAIYDKRPEGA